METLSDIAVFVRTVDLGSFTAAANDLELSKAAVSKYVGRLEKRLGARLLNRTTRRLTLTEAGEALYQGSAGALEDIHAAEAGVRELAGTPRGRRDCADTAYLTTPPRAATRISSWISTSTTVSWSWYRNGSISPSASARSLTARWWRGGWQM